MTIYSATLLECHIRELRAAVYKENQHEGAAYLLCGKAEITSDPWENCRHIKLLSRQVLPVTEKDTVSSSNGHITWKTDSLVRALKIAERENLITVIVHSHPSGHSRFSDQDDQNEPELVQLCQNRSGQDCMLGSIILTRDDDMLGRIWLNPHYHEPIQNFRVVGSRISLRYPGRGHGAPKPQLQRQALAFGDVLNEDLNMLRVGFVGLGGTGSPSIMLGTRLGIGQIASFDRDIGDVTNLHRVHGLTQTDVSLRRYKVDAVTESNAQAGLSNRYVKYPYWVGDERCRDALKACDVIFGGTDDHDGRLFLNRLAYFYHVPVIDMGLGIEASKNEVPKLMQLDGRVTYVLPGYGCLLCRNIINPAMAAEQALKRADVSEFERRKQEAYVAGEGNPNPVVVTFTTEVATMAMNELLHRLTGFRTVSPDASNWLRKFQLMETVRPGYKRNPHCKICESVQYWGRGDVEPFLDRVG